MSKISKKVHFYVKIGYFTVKKCHILLAARILQLSTWNFFERYFYAQRNGLRTRMACFGDIATFWESLLVKVNELLFAANQVFFLANNGKTRVEN